MNNFPDEDPKLLNFLRQNRSIAPLESPNLEDRLMSEIDFIPIKKSKGRHTWRRYIAGGVGIMATGILGIGIDRLMNPPEPSMAQLQQLNLFLEAHAHNLVDADTSKEDRDNSVDSDADLLLETDIDVDSVDG
jgi:hypothetical protein